MANRRRPKRPKPRTVQRPSGPDPFRLGLGIPGSPRPKTTLTVEGPVASELVDLVSIFNDLLVAGMAAYFATGPDLREASLVYGRRACWEGAIVAYARCFVSGQGTAGRRSQPLETYIEELEPRLRECHEYILHLRDKRVGHHVAGEAGQTGQVYFGVDVASTQVVLNDVFLDLDSEFYDLALMESLGALTQTLRGRLGARIDSLRQDLMALARDHQSEVLRAVLEDRPWNAPSAG